MSIKHKVLKDFQLVTNDKKIIILKAKTVLQNYKYISKNDNVLVEKELVDNNPDFFSPVDWKEEMTACLKTNKIPQPSIVTKKLIPFIEEMFIINQESSSNVNDEDQLEEIRQRERDLENKTRKKYNELSQKELEIENKLRRIETKEKQVQNDLEEFNRREDDILKKERTLSDKESKLRRYESDLRDKESNLDSMILDSHTNLDSKHQEMNDKIESRMREVRIKEEEMSKLESDLNEKISSKESEISRKEKDLESKISSLDNYVKKEDIRTKYLEALSVFSQKGHYTQEFEEFFRLMNLI